MKLSSFDSPYFVGVTSHPAFKDIAVCPYYTIGSLCVHRTYFDVIFYKGPAAHV